MNRVGIDVSNEVFDACLKDAKGLCAQQFPNTRAGHRDHLHYLKKRIDVIKRQAVKLLQTDPCLAEDLSIVKTAPGFAQLSATKLIAELSPLAADLTPRQWVAQSGLDPRPRESGSSVHPPRRISKNGNPRIREALFMPALTAIRSDPNVNAFYNSLLARGKQKMQAVTAVMRKLLHALWGMLHHRQTWDGSKFYAIPDSA